MALCPRIPVGCHAITLPSDMPSMSEFGIRRTPLVNRFTMTQEFFGQLKSERQNVG